MLAQNGCNALHAAAQHKEGKALAVILGTGKCNVNQTTYVSTYLPRCLNVACFWLIRSHSFAHAATLTFWPFNASTALHMCAREGNLEGIKALMAAGADPTIVDKVQLVGLAF